MSRVGNPGPDLIGTIDPLLTGHHIRSIERQSPPPPPTASPPKPNCARALVPFEPCKRTSESACVRMGRRRGRVVMCNMILPSRPFSFHPTVEKFELAEDRTPQWAAEANSYSGQQLTSSQLRAQTSHAGLRPRAAMFEVPRARGRADAEQERSWCWGRPGREREVWDDVMTAHPGGGGRGGWSGPAARGVQKKRRATIKHQHDKGGPKEENLRYVVWRNRYCNRSTKRNEKREGNYSSELMITT